MKEDFENIKKMAKHATVKQQILWTEELVDKIVTSDKIYISLRKKFVYYGTWQCLCWANIYYFGRDLAYLIEQSFNNVRTHDEEKVFKIEDNRENLYAIILESL